MALLATFRYATLAAAAAGVAMLTSSAAFAASSRYCESYATDYADRAAPPRGEVARGILGGAGVGAIIGGIAKGSKGAGTGAIIGGTVGGGVGLAVRSAKWHDAYDYAFARCMAGPATYRGAPEPFTPAWYDYCDAKWLTFDPAVDERPRWTLGGQRVVFASGRDGVANLYWKAADGTGEVERLTESQEIQAPYSWSSDGTQLLIHDGRSIAVLSIEGERSVEPLLPGAAPRYPAISPDGRWMAYKSLESGQDEVYVRPFPDVNSGRWQISPDLGDDPIWSRDGRELFYRGPGGQMMAVPVETEPTFNPGNPEALFGGPYPEGGGVQYDVAPDGQRFLMIKGGGGTDGPAAQSQIVVVQNWFQELERLVPTP